MHHFRLASEQKDLPAAADPDSAARGMEFWIEAAEGTGNPEIRAFAQAVGRDSNQHTAESAGRCFLEAIFGNSPYLTQSILAEPAFTHMILTEGPDSATGRVMEEIACIHKQSLDEATLARTLRIAKRKMALAVAAADVAGAWPLERITGALSDFARQALRLAVSHLLRSAAANGAFVLPHPEDPERGSGMIVLAMGKLGAGELNYSSDIDLIILFDRERVKTDAPEKLQNNFVRLARGLVKLLDERTTDGYVFRTDLRLRPDPGSTPLAISAEAAETYYETLGQNWERAAMIKARPIAGDLEAGDDFLARLKPFVWRKNLDFAAIQDIHSIKRQINAYRGGARIAVAGHNIKLGRGGIREIEFFVQTQQLIWGGREPSLRGAKTVEVLRTLAGLGQITAETAEDLIAAYRFLRRVEHRLQMIGDEQTHTLPSDTQGLTGLSRFLGYDDLEEFTEAAFAHLHRVETHYANLFEDAPALSAAGPVAGNLVFTGGDPDPETLETLAGLGYQNTKAVDDAIRGWHHGRYRSTRSARARELLTELMPTLVTELSGTPDPDMAFFKFDEFLSHLPSGIQLFSMFHSNPQLLNLVAGIMGAAPRLAESLSRRPALLDGVLNADFLAPLPHAEELDQDLDKHLTEARDTEDILDLSRRWAGDRKFQVGVQFLNGHLPAGECARALSDIAETIISRLLPRMEAEFRRRHGAIAGSGMAVIALGKLGGREMTPASDLDLVFVYTCPPDAESSNGERPLPPSQYFARLSQRLINAITAPTAEGQLYDVDMRLRPSGNAGPIASSLEAFVKYNLETAWTWEHMALTRARVVAGPEELRLRVESTIRDVLTRPRDTDALLRDVADMRARMAAEHGSTMPWDLKHLRGGLVDVEFIAQYLQLRHGPDHPQVLSPNTRMALKRIGDLGLLEPKVASDLIGALDLWQPLQAMLRLTMAKELGNKPESDVPEALRKTLARVGGVETFSLLKAKISAAAATVQGHFSRLIEAPAKRLDN